MNERDEDAGATARALMKASELKEAAQKHSGLALETLTKIMEGDVPPAVKLAAARELLDRAHGKPQPAAKPKASKAPLEIDGGMTVIIKRFSDVTPEEEAAADATERGEL